MEEICLTPDINIKTIEINDEDKKYKCQIQTIKDFLLVSLFIGDNLKHEGNIHIYKIQTDLGIYNFSINDILEEINLLNKESFKIIKEANKNKLKIEFVILRKKKYLYIDLIKNENMNLVHDDLIKTISELKEMIKTKDDKIKLLEEELNRYKPKLNKDDNSYEHFDIKQKEQFIN